MFLIITEEKYVAIDTDDYSCHEYYVIKFSSFTYNLQAGLIIDGQVISFGNFLCEGTYFFTVSINYHYYALQRTKSINTIFL